MIVSQQQMVVCLKDWHFALSALAFWANKAVRIGTQANYLYRLCVLYKGKRGYLQFQLFLVFHTSPVDIYTQWVATRVGLVMLETVGVLIQLDGHSQPLV